MEIEMLESGGPKSSAENFKFPPPYLRTYNIKTAKGNSNLKQT